MQILKITTQPSSPNFERKIRIKDNPQLLEKALAITGVSSIGTGIASSASNPISQESIVNETQSLGPLSVSELNNMASKTFEQSNPAILTFLPSSLLYSGSDILDRFWDSLKSK